MKSRLMTLLGGTLALAGLLPTSQMTESDRFINSFTLQQLCDEYNLIQEKKSNYSRSQRDSIEGTIHYLKHQGKVEIENGKAKLYIRVYGKLERL